MLVDTSIDYGIVVDSAAIDTVIDAVRGDTSGSIQALSMTTGLRITGPNELILIRSTTRAPHPLIDELILAGHYVFEALAISEMFALVEEHPEGR